MLANQLKTYYRDHENYNDYLMKSKERVKSLKNLYNNNKKYFGKKVLDLTCGGGVMGFIVENKGHSYTGMDINPDMIQEAKKYAKEFGGVWNQIFSTADRLEVARSFEKDFESEYASGNRW